MQPAIQNAALKEPLVRLIRLIEAETRALENAEPFDFEHSNRSKGQGLLDLMRRSRHLACIEPDFELRELLAALRAAISLNQSVIKVNLDAAKTVAGIIAAAIEDEESDKTYSARIAVRVLPS